MFKKVKNRKDIERFELYWTLHYVNGVRKYIDRDIIIKRLRIDVLQYCRYLGRDRYRLSVVF